MEAAHRASWRYALLLLLPLIAAGGADGLVRIDSRTDTASPRPGENFVWAYDAAEEGSLLNKRRLSPWSS